MALDFDHEETDNGGSKWPSSHVIKGIHPETGDEVGFLKYRTPRRAKDKIQIDRLEVHPEHKGNGFGSAMMDHLQERHPKTPIDHGERTDEGKAWWKSYTRGKSVTRGRTVATRDERPIVWQREASADDGLDDAQRHALGRLDGFDEVIPHHQATQLMHEHGIHFHDDDPIEAGDVDEDEHLVHSSQAPLVHHPAHVPLHTSQAHLYRSALEHYIRNPYTGGGGIGPRPGEPKIWEHEGQHWVNEGHHRILADRMTHGNGVKAHDLTNRRRLGFRVAARQTPRRVFHHDPGCPVCSMPGTGLVRHAVDLPVPHPNPYREKGEGGPEGHHWYHGTTFDPGEDRSGGTLKTPTGHSGEYGERADEHWNTDLGVHFTSMRDVAHENFANDSRGKLTPTSRIAHATLHMRNPIHFKDEGEMAHHAISWARDNGHRFLPENIQAHKAFIHRNFEHVEEHDDRERDGNGRSYDYLHKRVGTTEESRKTISDIDRHGPNRGHDEDATEKWLGAHPDRERIMHGYRQHLQIKGHDGITYGNSYEGPRGHTCAIAFPTTPVKVHNWEWLHPDHQKEARYDRTAGKGKPRHHAPDVARRADAEGEGRSQGVAPDSGRDADGGGAREALRPLAEHPKVDSDLAKLPKKIREVYHARVDDLRRGQPHSSTHSLNGPLKGWSATNLNFQYRMVHKHIGDELHVLSAGNHDETYDIGKRRIGSARPLYHGTSRDFSEVRPSKEHGHEVFEGLSSPEHAYATHDPQQAKTYAEISEMMHGGRARVYEVHHLGQPHDLEHDPGYDADVRSRAGFRVLREVPGHELKNMPKYAAQSGPRCPCGLPVELDPADGWQHADGSISHDGDLSRYSVSDLMDLGRLPKKIDPRRRSFREASALYDNPERWSFKQNEWDSRDRHNIEHTKSFGEYTLHAEPKYDDGDRQLHVTTQDGQHVGEAYTGEHPSHPGHIELAPEVHPDHRRKGIGTALYDYAEELAGRPAAPAAWHTDEAEAFWQNRQRKHGRYTAPKKRLFGPTYGLDTRLWDGKKLKQSVRQDVLATFAAFCRRHDYRAFREWARVVFFGSEASEWTSKDLRGNNDFDLSIGIEYTIFRSANPSFRDATDEQIAAAMTREMHAELNDPAKTFEGVEGVYDQTWFANLQGWSIERIRPYAAYNVLTEQWIVRPPHLPDWSAASFPQGPGLAEEVRGIIEMAQGILKMPEPHRTQNGAALWEFVHSNRSNAFGGQGEGWWDSRNVVEKALDQKGLMQQLFELHRRAAEDPSTLDAPKDWSNDPARAR